MNLGTTFLRADSDKHLWIVLSDPNKNCDYVLLVNMTTWDTRKENVCLLNPSDHPWITHQSCINFGDAVVTTLAKLLEAKDGGVIELQAPLTATVLQRILDAVPSSSRISLENADLLMDQGLVDF